MLLSILPRPPPATHYLGYDGHGSTRILTDSSSAIAPGSRYDYDAYGVQLGVQASVVSPALTSLLYTGEQFDSGLQQYYLRARYYNQNNGRFSQFDTFGGYDSDPQSLHKYDYGQTDPIKTIDPSGRSLVQLVATVAVQAILIGVLVAAFGSVLGYGIASTSIMREMTWCCFRKR